MNEEEVRAVNLNHLRQLAMYGPGAAAFSLATALALLDVVEAAQRFRHYQLASTDGKQAQRGQRSKLLQEMGERLDAALAPFTEQS